MQRFSCITAALPSYDWSYELTISSDLRHLEKLSLNA